jgi:dipeptidyl aminopeptidase/acylaminoacyl peptidase
MKQGFVTLVIDTYGTRGFRNTKAAGENQKGTGYQLADAYGAFTYLSKLKIVDKKNIGIVGGSRGGHTTLMALAKQNSLPKYLDVIGAKPGRFRAGVA